MAQFRLSPLVSMPVETPTLCIISEHPTDYPFYKEHEGRNTTSLDRMWTHCCNKEGRAPECGKCAEHVFCLLFLLGFKYKS